MLKDIVEVFLRPSHRLWIRFEDGLSGEVDIAEATGFDGVFSALRDEAMFARVTVNQELGTIHWPNGADLDPDVLYAAISGQKINVAA